MNSKVENIGVLPVTESLFHKKRKEIIDSGDAAIRGAGYDGGGDTYDDNLFRHASMLKVASEKQASDLTAAFNQTTQEIAARPTQTEVVEPFHVVKVIYPEESIPENIHIVAPIDSMLVSELIKINPDYKLAFGEDIIASVATPLVQSLIQHRRGETITWTGGEGGKFSAKIADTPDAIMVTPLFELSLNGNNQEP